MKAVNAVSFLTSSQSTSGTQPVAAGFRQPAGDNPAVQGFAGQLASLSSTPSKQGSGEAVQAPTPEQVPQEAEQAQAETAEAQLPDQTSYTLEDDLEQTAAQSDQPELSDMPEITLAIIGETGEELAETAQAKVSAIGDLQVQDLAQSAKVSVLTELVKNYQASVRGAQAADMSVATRNGQAASVATTPLNSQSVSQEYQRLLTTATAQNFSASEVRGLNLAQAEVLKVAVQSGAAVGTQALLDSRPDLLTATQRSSTVSEWAPIKVADQQSQHWGRDLMAALGDRLTMQVNQKVKSAQIRLDPPELGRIEMTVRLEGDRLNIQLNASNQQVRDLLAQHADRLRADLLAQNHQSVDVHVGHQNDQRDSRPGYQRDEIIGNGLLVAETPDTLTTMQSNDSWLSTKA